jgi:ribosomal protein S19E (S16A)
MTDETARQVHVREPVGSAYLRSEFGSDTHSDHPDSFMR